MTAVPLLPVNATPLERALDDVLGTPIDALPAELRKLWKPQECPPEFLSWLAWAVSTDIWDQTWPEEKKRFVIGEMLSLHRIKGTETAIRAYVDIADAAVVEILRAPQSMFLGPDLSKDDFDAWVKLHPKVRVTLARGTIEAMPDDEGFFLDFSHLDVSFDTVDLGPALIGRRAYLVRDGVETPLIRYDVTDVVGTREGVIHERVVTPGLAGDSFFIGDGMLDVSFLDAADRPPSTHTYTLRCDYAHTEATLALDLVPVGFEPRDYRYMRESETGTDPWGFYLDASFSDDHFLTLDVSGEMLADVIYLFDPLVPSPELVGVSFLGVDRFGFPPNEARILVDPKLGDIPGAFYVGEGFLDDGFALPNDESKLDRITGAIASSQSLSDRIGVTFQTYRPRTFDDGIPMDGFEFGELIPNTL